MRLLCSLVALSTITLACGSSQPNTFDTPGDDGGLDGSSNDDADPFLPGDSGGDSNSGITLGCSGDLRNVIDGNGVVQQQCPPDQGCAGGKCIVACDAAAASQGSVGCDYVVATPSFYAGIKPPCFAVFVANNWPKDVKLTVTRGGTSYNVSQFGRIAQAGVKETSWAPIPSTGLPPGKVAVLFMSHDPASVNGGPLICPIAPAISQTYGTALPNSGSSPSITGRGQAWHIATDLPVTAYDILPYGGASSYLPSAELLYPTTAWGTNYFGIVPLRGTASPQWGQLVAAQDNTNVTVLPNVTLPAGTNVITAPTNVATKYVLKAGEYIQWQESMEMSSTVIQSDKPVSFTGGQGYDCYQTSTSTGGGCDSAHQQVMPISAFGAEYLVPAYRTRRADNQDESIKYRLVGAVAGTTLSYSPQVPGAPTTVKNGQVIDFEATGSFVVKSQDINHPFYVGQIMPGCFVTGGSRNGCTGGGGGCCLGDEEYVNVLPPAQYLNKYVFFTDPTYPTTNLVFTRVKTAQGFQDVNLDCAGVLKGWKPVGSTGQYEVTNIDLIFGGTKTGTCDNGPHTASSTGPFGVMVWGEDSASSYAYPAGGNVAPINTVVVQPVPN
jgi:IgGFc binding protein